MPIVGTIFMYNIIKCMKLYVCTIYIYIYIYIYLYVCMYYVELNKLNMFQMGILCDSI